MDIDMGIHDSSMDIHVYTTDIHKDSSTWGFYQYTKLNLLRDISSLKIITVKDSYKASLQRFLILSFLFFLLLFTRNALV